jgi:F-type H+-transporting ATPase subunit a
MSAASATAPAAPPPKERRFSTKQILLGATAIYVLGMILLIALVPSEGKNEEFQPQEEFRLTPWIDLNIAGIDMSINRAVFYLILACVLTCVAMVWVAKRMQQKPNRVQTAVEALHDITFNTITRSNMSSQMTAKWFPFVATLFFFIWISNLLGYIPLPTNTHATVDVFGVNVPTLAIYAATANLSIPLVLTLIVWVAYQVEGVRAHGLMPYLKGWIPSGTPGFMKPMLFGIEAISQLVRIISLSVRLFANILAGHLLILFMGGGLGVLLGLAALGWLTFPLALAFFLFEVVLVATLQAFIFATLTSIYFGEATSAEGH